MVYYDNLSIELKIILKIGFQPGSNNKLIIKITTGFYVDPDEVNKIAFKVFDQDRDGKITKKGNLKISI